MTIMAGRPYVQCGGSARYARGGKCVACARAQCRAYYAANPEKERARSLARYRGVRFRNDYFKMMQILLRGRVLD